MRFIGYFFDKALSREYKYDMCHIQVVTHFRAMIAGHVIIVNLNANMVLKQVTVFIQELSAECEKIQPCPIELVEERIRAQYPNCSFINELPFQLHTVFQF